MPIFTFNCFIFDTCIFYRRLCPDISFFQQGTEFPCKVIVTGSGQKRLHRRVQHTVLRSANVERKGLGVTKVLINYRITEIISVRIAKFRFYLAMTPTRMPSVKIH